MNEAITKSNRSKDATTKDIILDAAEELFARNGYYGTSIRHITAEAQVNLASVNYHFGSKENLLKAVIERRFVPINEARFKLLDSVLNDAKKKKKKPPLKGIINAFVTPGFEAFSDNKSLANLVSIITVAMAKQDGTVKNLISQIVMPMFNRFFEALKLAMCDSSDEEVMIKMQFMIGTFFHIIRFYFVNDMPVAMKENLTMDKQQIKNMTVNFIEAGLKTK